MEGEAQPAAVAKPVRKLRCLYSLSALITEVDTLLPDIMRRAVALIPPAYQYPEAAGARIRCPAGEFGTPGFVETRWEQTAAIGGINGNYGSIQVCYREAKPEEDEGPFLEEERELINTVGELLGDFLERRRAAESARQSEERLHVLLNGAPIMLWAVDDNEIFTLSRGSTLARLGLKPGQLVGRSVQSLKRSAPGFHERLSRALAGEEVTADITWGDFTFQSRSTPIVGPEGQVEGVIGVLTDITKRVEAEQELRRSNALLEEVFASTNFHIASLDKDFTFVRVNARYAAADGRSPESFIGKNHFDLYPDEENRVVFQNVLDTGEPFSARERPFAYRDHPERGTTYWDVDILPRKRPDGSVEGLLLVLVDRTLRKKALLELEKSREELRNLALHLQDVREDDRRHIAREIHDELGGLLTALKMEVQTRRADAFASAEDLANQAVVMIRRIAADLRPRVLDDFGLFPALEWQVQEFRRRANIRCDLDISGRETVVSGEKATAIFRIFQEALTNVARHARASRVRVTVKAEDGSIRLEVTDNGVGIGEAKITDPRSFGLIGIHERAAALGATVSIRGAPSRGTTVVLLMPT
jgi:PAS domain S-box-containing protein